MGALRIASDAISGDVPKRTPNGNPAKCPDNWNLREFLRNVEQSGCVGRNMVYHHSNAARRGRNGAAMTKDETILETVAKSIAAAQADGEDWAASIEADLRREGIETADNQPDGSDPWEIVYLADERMVVLADESARGAAQYSIVDRV